MNKELQDKLFNRFSFYKNNLSIKENLMGFGFECGNGWFDLIWEFSEKLEELELKDSADKVAKILLLEKGRVIVVQVKEKFGELRIYLGNATDEMYNLAENYCEKSAHICEECGKPTKVENSYDGWIKTLCEDCLKRRKNE